MNKATYDEINEYCTKKYAGILTSAEKDFVLRKFLDSYYAAIEQFKKAHNGAAPNDSEHNTIIRSLLSDDILNSYIDSATKYYIDIENTIITKYQSQQKTPSFWRDVLVNVFSNVLYSLLLVFLFWLAKDQIATWLIQLAG